MLTADFDSGMEIERYSTIFNSDNSKIIQASLDDFLLGLPGLFLHDGLDGEISIGGGQLMSCPQLARIGQLLVS